MKGRIKLFENETELRGFAPIGMLECRNDGIVGFGKMERWVIEKIHLGNDPDKKGIIFINDTIPLKANIPLFHPSIVPCMMRKIRASINHFFQ
jgi:hypothetical protein